MNAPMHPAARRAQIAVQICGQLISRFRLPSDRAIQVAYDLVDDFDLEPQATTGLTGKSSLVHRGGLTVIKALDAAMLERSNVATAADLADRSPQPA
jgi:hypothetical protein